MSSRLPQTSLRHSLHNGLPQDIETAHQLIHELLSVIQSLEARLDQLEEQQGTSSRNSSKPPSGDTPAQRAKRPRKKGSGRQKGAQPGHTKHERVQLDESDIPESNRHRHYPDIQCDCGGLRQLSTMPVRRHQVFDLPEVSYEVEEHQLFEGHCPCCQRRAVGALPPGVPTGQMGAGLISWITLMNGAYNQSLRSIQRLLQAQWQLGFSLGAISQATRPVSHWLAPLYQQVFQTVCKEPVVHADETSHYRQRSRFWLWVMCSPRVAFFMTHHSRGKGAANALLASFTGILVSDQHGGYNDHPMEQRQLCWAHVIRKFRNIASRAGRAGVVGRELLRLSQLMVHFHHRWLAGHYSHVCYQRRMAQIRDAIHHRLQRGLALRRVLQPDKPSLTSNQCRRLLHDEPMLWTFLRAPTLIPLTNNTAEQALRPYVIWRKTSFASQSVRGDQFRPIILTVVETCKRLGIDSYALLRKVCAQGLSGQPVTARLPIPCLQLESIPA